MKTISRLITLSVILLIALTAWVVTSFHIPVVPQTVLLVAVTWVVSGWFTASVIWAVAKKLGRTAMGVVGGLAKSVGG